MARVCGPDGGNDLLLLVPRAAYGLRVVVDRVARAHGLNEFRDAMVLTVLTDDTHRSQLESAQLVGLDDDESAVLLLDPELVTPAA